MKICSIEELSGFIKEIIDEIGKKEIWLLEKLHLLRSL